MSDEEFKIKVEVLDQVFTISTKDPKNLAASDLDQIQNEDLGDFVKNNLVSCLENMPISRKKSFVSPHHGRDLA